MMLKTAIDTRRRYAAAAMAGVGAYIAVDAVLQLLPPHYSLIRDAESNLAVGRFGWIMNLNFLGRAATTMCAVAAIGRTSPATGLRRTGMVLLTAAAASSAVLAFFATDVASDGGLTLPDPTSEGTVHLWVAGLGFLAALAAVVVLTIWLRSSPELGKTYPRAAVLAAVAAGGLLSLGLSAGFAPGVVGLTERICLAGILGWAFVVAAGIRRLP